MRTTDPRRAPLACVCAALTALMSRPPRPGRRHWSRSRGFRCVHPGRTCRGRRGSRRGRCRRLRFLGLALRGSPDRRPALAPAAAPAPGHGVRDATHFAPSCPQLASPFAPPAPSPRTACTSTSTRRRCGATLTGRCWCGSTAVASPRTAPATTTAPSSPRTAPSSSRSTTGSARSGSSPIPRSRRGRAARPATTA